MNPALHFTFFIPLIIAMAAPFQIASADQHCQLKYPIVLSHHWSSREICPPSWDPEDCDAREPAKYCALWEQDQTHGDMDCKQWRIPDDELDLPPRNYNVVDPTLQRDASGYHRYYSREVVDRLQSCGNAVFLADKPAFSTYHIRARSLRETVRQALNETGAQKVIIIGLSQGSQDARFMAAALPMDDSHPEQGMMSNQVAAIVSTAGEPHGTQSASLLLDNTNITNYLTGHHWGDYTADNYWPESRVNGLQWEDSATPGHQYVLVEGFDANDPNQYDMQTDNIYRNYLGSIAVLSPRYMIGKSYLTETIGNETWEGLMAYLQLEESGWQDLIPADYEINSGIEYYSYAAKINHFIWSDWDDAEVYFLIQLLYGDNDGHVTVDAQRFDTLGYPNFHHVATLSGSNLGRGYHHMFFTGRNDDLFAPLPLLQQKAPYRGGAPDFYEALATHLKNEGF